MKISETLGNPPNVAGTAVKDDRKVSGSKEVSFQSHLKRVENDNLEERIHGLVNGIIEQGEKLGKKTDIRELKKYKDLISEFLEEAVGSSHKFSKKNFLDRRGRHRVYAVVKKVNEKLELLTRDILSAEKDNIGILQKLDDIRGLILDILL